MFLARESRYGCNFMDLGFTPGMGTTRLLQAAVGPYVAAEMMLGAKYFRGAELVSIYPVSIVTHGQALNITCESYAGMMNFGFTGCHSSLPSMQKLAVHAAEALDELEATFLPPPKPARRRTPAAKPAARTRRAKAAA